MVRLVRVGVPNGLVLPSLLFLIVLPLKMAMQVRLTDARCGAQ